MKFILAVSGGVDSMVLFDVFLKKYGVSNIIVAHFNHKLRPSADEDEEFVASKCKEADVRFEVGYLDTIPGEKVSEEKARKARYDFLFNLRKKIEMESHCAVMVVTAHHLDDLTETVAINLVRGTGWRGLTPFSNSVMRPFITEDDVLMPESKADILTYAARNKISYRQDPTNFEPDFLRNRIREKISTMEPQEHYELNQKIKKLYRRQDEIRAEIDWILTKFLEEEKYFEEKVAKREWFFDLDDTVATELLRRILEIEKISLTRPQLADFLLAIRTYQPEKKFNLPGDKLVTMHKNYFKL